MKKASCVKNSLLNSPYIGLSQVIRFLSNTNLLMGPEKTKYISFANKTIRNLKNVLIDDYILKEVQCSNTHSINAFFHAYLFIIFEANQIVNFNFK